MRNSDDDEISLVETYFGKAGRSSYPLRGDGYVYRDGSAMVVMTARYVRGAVNK